MHFLIFLGAKFVVYFSYRLILKTVYFLFVTGGLAACLRQF